MPKEERYMKKVIAILIVLLLYFLALVGCGLCPEGQKYDDEDGCYDPKYGTTTSSPSKPPPKDETEGMCYSDYEYVECVDSSDAVYASGSSEDEVLSLEGTYAVVYNECADDLGCSGMVKWNESVQLIETPSAAAPYKFHTFNGYWPAGGDTQFTFGDEEITCTATVVEADAKDKPPFSIVGVCNEDTRSECKFEYTWQTSAILAKDGITCEQPKEIL